MSDPSVSEPPERAAVTVYGSGSMGTAMALHLVDLGHAVTLWTRTGAKAERLRSERSNPLLPGHPLPAALSITADAAAAVAADWHLLAVPSKYLRAQLETLSASLGDRPRRFISVIKGIENDSLARPTQIVAETLPATSLTCLSGPSHAEEIAAKQPTSMVAASEDEAAAAAVQELFNSDRLRVYTNRDLTGVELAGALKNVFGLAAGICDGIGFGDNAKAALLTRAVTEMQRFGAAFGAAEDTFAGLAGIGDLIATCTSRHGRNRSVGERLGRGESLDQILDSMGGSVSEGVPTTASIFAMSRRRGIEMPIVDEVHAVLFDGKSVASAAASLLTRPVRSETGW